MTQLASSRRPLAGMLVTELQSLLGSRARAIEVVRWLHTGRDSDVPPHISARSWEQLRSSCDLPHADVVDQATSEDGTTKFLLSLKGSQVEAVCIPAENRSTICVSSQAGCSRKCDFCATAALGFGRNLDASEMITQFLVASRGAPANAPVRNVVFMGMGEPMDNLDQVLRAVELLTQAPAPQLRAERVTVSTSGVLPGMLRFLRESKASLALSLNASTDAQRERLMPQTRQWPIAALLQALRDDAVVHPKRVHFIEYVMIDGLNDADEDAARLCALLEGINARVNLIPHNPFPGRDYQPSPRDRVLAFQKRVAEAGIRALVRWPRGVEISAACGQLARRRNDPASAPGPGSAGGGGVAPP
jgi:23S rRNA (adenine2503-C2)-methyltransferase